jgi:two-component system sensor histidine kinase YesM
VAPLRSIKTKIFLSIFAVSCVVLAILALIYDNYINASISRYELDYALASTDYAVRNVEQFLKAVEIDVESLQKNPQILQCLKSSVKTPESGDRINQILRETTESKDYLDDAYIRAENGALYSELENEFDLNLLRERIETILAFGSNRLTPLLTVTTSSRNKSLVFYSAPIYDIGAQERLATLFLDINYDYIVDLFINSSSRNSEKAVLINDAGEIILGYPIYTSFEPFLRDNPEIFQSPYTLAEKDVYKQSSIVVSMRLRNSNWYLARILSKERVYKDSTQLMILLAAVAFTLFFLSLAIAYFLAHAITKPLRELGGKISRVDKGDLTVEDSEPPREGDELKQLSFAFDNMVRRLNKYMQNELDIQKKSSEMEFAILQGQINPHFLYNTLDSVKWLAALQNENNICDMVSALINTLRYNLSSDQPFALLRQEIENIRNYVTIQKFRYGDAFTVKYSLEPESLNCPIMRFTLQPIVENAIFHGMENYSASGVIEIRGMTDGEYLLLEVADNGKGFEAENPLPENLRRRAKNKFSGIGLTNIRDRYELHYHERFQMNLAADGTLGGANISLRIPIT